MKKLTALLLAVALMCGCVVCASAEETLTWWDHFATLMETHQKIFDAFEAETGIKVEYQNFDAASFKDSIDLAIIGNQCPDIFPQMWGNNKEIEKYYENTFSPLAIDIEDLPEYVQNSLVEGYTMFDGKVYSFPTMALNHNALLWYNKELVSEVPDTLAELRETFKSVTDPEKNQYAIALPLTDANRMNDIITYIAAASGGYRTIDYTTGKYSFNSDLTKQVFQFFVDIWEDGSVHPASTTLKTRTVRERWVNNECVFAIDGTWYPGSVRTAFGDDPLPKLAVHGAPVVDKALAEEKGLVGMTPASGTFYVASTCKNVEAATKLLLNLLDDDYAVALANAMDQPPLNTEAIAKADKVVPVYVEGCNIMANEVGYYPEPMVRNPDVAEVYAELMTITPNVGDIYVGYVTGSITDWETALDEYTAQMDAELDRAIAAAQSAGADVSREDWIFPNFVPGTSYTSDKYAELAK